MKIQDVLTHVRNHGRGARELAVRQGGATAGTWPSMGRSFARRGGTEWNIQAVVAAAAWRESR